MSNSDRAEGSSEEHYERLLAQVYDWMQGGWDQRAEQNRQLFQELKIEPSASGATAVDLGAGTGYQSIPLAELGFAVTAIDSSAAMLDRLTSRAAESDDLAGSVTTVACGLCQLNHLISEPVELFVCMGDTLSHLGTHTEVSELLAWLIDQLTSVGYQPPEVRVELGMTTISTSCANLTGH